MPYFSSNSGLDRAVVRPVVGQGDDVELALGLSGGDERVEAAERLGARGGRGVDVGVGRLVGRAGAGGETDRERGHRGDAENGVLVEHSSSVCVRQPALWSGQWNRTTFRTLRAESAPPTSVR